MCFLQVFTKSGNKNKYSEKGQAYYSNFRNVLISRYKIIMDVSNRILDKSKISNLTKTLWNGPKNDILPHNSAFWIFEPCSPKQNMCPKCSIQVNPPKKSVVIFWLNQQNNASISIRITCMILRVVIVQMQFCSDSHNTKDKWIDF